MKQMTIENKLRQYPYVVWATETGASSRHPLIQFICEKNQAPIDQIFIDENGIHYLVDEGNEVNDKGFYFFTEEAAQKFLNQHCTLFNKLQIHVGDPIYYNGNTEYVRSAYIEEKSQKLYITTKGYIKFDLSELGVSFSLTYPDHKTVDDLKNSISRLFTEWNLENEDLDDLARQVHIFLEYAKKKRATAVKKIMIKGAALLPFFNYVLVCQ